jgi:hypothetical protein
MTSWLTSGQQTVLASLRQGRLVSNHLPVDLGDVSRKPLWPLVMMGLSWSERRRQRDREHSFKSQSQILTGWGCGPSSGAFPVSGGGG